MDEWQFDNELNVWYLHLSIVIECETPYFPQKSQWFFVVGSEYPKGKIKVYPDVENSITVTLYHQANNSKIERNGLWRKGALEDYFTIGEKIIIKIRDVSLRRLLGYLFLHNALLQFF